MKKLFLILIILILVGCNNNKYEKTMEEYSQTFYNLHIKGQKRNQIVTISIADLKEANEVVGDDYDLKKLKKCQDDSYVELEIDENFEIKNIKYNLKCD